MKKKLLFLLIFLLTLNLFSQDFSIRLEQLKIENQNCLDTGTSMQRCALNYYSKSDRLLNVVYKHIQENLSSLEKENLKQEQLSWLKSKDEKFSKISNQNTGHGNGLDDLMIKNHKKAEVINIRTKHLISKFLDKNKTVISKAEFIKIVPKNYSILDTVSGDLNRDEFLDYILVLKKNNEENTSNFMDDKQELRPLILLVGNSKNELTKVGQNDTTVLCYDCGGAMGDPYTGITIKNGYFSVEHYGGSSWRWTTIITYKYSKKEKNWFLHKKGGVSFHASTPNNIEEKVKTKKDFGVVKFEDFNIYD
tara:strand:+ start:665 stop:1585 length:921 start_codon:yes stop_codon:yes gene_type:complete